MKVLSNTREKPYLVAFTRGLSEQNNALYLNQHMLKINEVVKKCLKSDKI